MKTWTPETLAEEPLEAIRALEPIECGSEAAKHFLFDDGYISLNNGSYGAPPIEIRDVFRHFQDLTEARPDEFVRYAYRTYLLDRSRSVIAKYLNCPSNDLVLVPNATTAFDTIARNLVYKPKDVVITFARSYGSFSAVLEWLAETTPLEVSQVYYKLPASDQSVCQAFETRVKELKAAGKNPRMAVFDTISSLPGTRMPFEKLIAICREHGVLSCVDGAHGVGLFPIDIQALDADFFTSNCHKWLFVPRPCAVLCVPKRNQKLLRTSVPVGFDWTPLKDVDRAAEEGEEPKDKVPGSEKSRFVKVFAYTGTLDDNPYLCIEAALEWRKKLIWKDKTGEEAVMDYIHDLARKGGERVAQILGTDVMENEEGTLGNLGFANVRLSLLPEEADCGIDNDYIYVDDGLLERGDTNRCDQIAAEIMRCMIQDYHIALFVYFYEGNWWARLSAQIFLTLEDFERAGAALKKACGLREWLLLQELPTFREINLK